MAKLASSSAVKPNTLPPRTSGMPPSEGWPATELLLHREQGHRRLGRSGALVELGRVGADDRLGLVLDREDAVADRDPVHGQRHDPAGAFSRHDLEMIG